MDLNIIGGFAGFIFLSAVVMFSIETFRRYINEDVENIVKGVK